MCPKCFAALTTSLFDSHISPVPTTPAQPAALNLFQVAAWQAILLWYLTTTYPLLSVAMGDFYTNNKMLALSMSTIKARPVFEGLICLGGGQLPCVRQSDTLGSGLYNNQGLLALLSGSSRHWLLQVETEPPNTGPDCLASRLDQWQTTLVEAFCEWAASSTRVWVLYHLWHQPYP